MADRSRFPVTPRRDLLFILYRLSAAWNTGYGWALQHFLRGGPAVGPSIGRPMVKLWPFRTCRKIGLTLGSVCFPLPIPPYDVLRHLKLRVSITVLLFRLMGRRWLSFEALLPVW